MIFIIILYNVAYKLYYIFLKNSNTIIDSISKTLYTRHKVDNLYFSYCSESVTFNKNVRDTTGLILNLVQLKCGEKTAPIIVYSMSMLNVNLIISVKNFSNFRRLNEKESRQISLKLAFDKENSAEPIIFFLPVKISASKNYNSDNIFLLVEFIRKPPDTIIIMLGELIKIKTLSDKREDKRIQVNKHTIKKLHFSTTSGILELNNIKKKCLVKDISFTGMKLIAAGNKQDFINKKVSIKLQFADNIGVNSIDGTIGRTDLIGESKDFVALGVSLDNNTLPFDYKNIIADFLSSNA